jgi:hypothetical protein
MGAGLVAVPACPAVVPSSVQGSVPAVVLSGGADGTIAEIPSATLPSVHRGLAPTHLGPAA